MLKKTGHRILKNTGGKTTGLPSKALVSPDIVLYENPIKMDD